MFREMAPRFGIFPTLTDVAVSEATVELASGSRCISVDHRSQIGAPLLRELRRAGVRFVSTRSVGSDHIDLRAAERLGIPVANVLYSPDSVADYTLMMILMALREAKSILRHADRGDYRLADSPGQELRDLTVGVVGVGRIGGAVIDRLRAFGCRVLAHDRCTRRAAEWAPLDDVVRRSDVITLHTPLTQETHHLLDRRRIEQMRHGAFVVNTGRGALVDTAALVWALESGRLGGAALDVVEGEEESFYADCPSRDVESSFLSRLQRLPNVVITPHTAYYTEHALRDIVEHTLVNCLRFEGRAAWIG